MSSESTDVALMLAAIHELLDLNKLKVWPGGYPDESEGALIDAVLSIRAKE